MPPATIRRTRFLHYCRGCGEAFYTNDANEAFCSEKCRATRYCPRCHRVLPLAAFQDRKGRTSEKCRDCHYTTDASPLPWVCPGCGGDPGTRYRCPSCTREHLRAYAVDGGDLLMTALPLETQDLSW